MISQRKNNVDEIAQARSNTGYSAQLSISSPTNSITDLEKHFEGSDCYASTQIDCDGSTNAKSIKLLIGVCGIYVCYLYYGTLQEEVYTYPKFHYVWFVQVLESFTNMMGAQIGRYFTKSADNSKSIDTNKKYRIAHYLFMLCGISQLCSKSLTSLSLNSGLAYPIATLAKSSRMAPVMAGQLLLGNSKYSPRDYLQVLCIILGTALLGLSKSKNNSSDSPSSTTGIYFIIMSLFMDGITGGLQKKIKEDAKATGDTVKSFDFMFFMNIYMFIVAIPIAIASNELIAGYHHVSENTELQRLILSFCLCSAAGQSFIFFTIANFDPLVCSTVTTTRKILSVLLSILQRGHILNHQGWSGILLAFIGIASELQHKFQLARSNEKKNLYG